MHSVGALELQDSVVGEDMLDGHNVVLRLLLSQLDRLAALEELPIAGKLWYLPPAKTNLLSMMSMIKWYVPEDNQSLLPLRGTVIRLIYARLHN